MKLLIPSIGDKLRLTKDWTFTVWSEYRNRKLGEVLGLLRTIPTGPWDDGRGGTYMQDREVWIGQDATKRNSFCQCIASGTCTLPKGTVLTVDRIFIRKGMKQFDSLSFLIHYSPDLKFVRTDIPFVKNVRFWARLSDCNEISFDFVEPT